MGVLTEKIRWVTSLTMEGDRLSADDLVLRRDMIAGVRIDRPGTRPSFVVSVLALLASILLAIAAFVDTRRFFDPSYALFALSLLPVVGTAAAAFLVRPRNHLTIMLRDGSALVMASRDATFLNLCLEAFERLWLDEDRARASLYLHAGHRSVDFGPAITGAPVETQIEQRTEAADLPLFPAELDDPVEVPAGDALETGVSEAVTGDDGPDAHAEAHHPAVDISPLPTDVSLSEPIREPVSVPVPIPVLPPPSFPDQGDTPAEPDRDAAAPPPLADWTKPAEDVVERYVIDPQVFQDMRPRIEALARLLHDRAQGQGVADAIDVLELLTRRGVASGREDRALRRSIEVLNGKLSMYPAAIELLDEVSRAAGEPQEA